MRRKVFLLLISAVFLTGLLLRTYKLTEFPASFTNDELAIAYNSYSILKTGKDEWGNFLPLSFRSVGDYKSPLLIYLMVPVIWIFGLSEYGTRISIALIGSLTVLLVFYIGKKLSGSNPVGLLTAFSLAISPWHINPSRITHDVVLGIFLLLAGIAVFLKSAEIKFRFLWVSAILFALSLYAYHALKIFTPLILLTLFLIYRKDLFENRACMLKGIIIGFLCIIPAIYLTLSPTGRVRADMTFITKDFEINRFLHKDEDLSFFESIFDNNFIITFNFWTKRYLDYTDLSFWFTRGMKFTLPNSPDIGLLYLFELPFLLIGLYLVFVRNIFSDNKKRLLIFFWLLIGPLAASLANNFQHVYRSLTLIPIPQFLTAVGLWYVFKYIRNKAVLFISAASLGLVVILNLVYFLNLYFINYPLYHSELLFDGWKKAALFAVENSDKYEQVIIDPRFGTLGPYTVANPYLYVLFYGNVQPNEFLNDPRREERYDSTDFRNFTFRSIDWADSGNSDKNRKNTLFIGSPWVLPAKDEEILVKFHIYNGKEILRAVTIK